MLAWLVFSFVFWKMLRSQGVEESRIFDLTFYATIVALVAGRTLFVLLHLSLFSDNALKVAAIWVQPGFSLYGGLVGAMGTMVFLSRKYKVRLAYVLDAWALAFPMSLLFGEIGSFLDASVVGKLTTLPWGISYLGHIGARHPVQLYEGIMLLILCIFSLIAFKHATREKWAYGLIGIWFFLLFSFVMFLVEFIKESGVYFLGLNVNQWILVAICAESLGALYIRGGGRERVRPLLRQIGGFFYVRFIKRFRA